MSAVINLSFMYITFDFKIFRLNVAILTEK